MPQNIWAVGRNYADHARELGNVTPPPSGEPLIFLKAGSCAVYAGQIFALPDFSQDVHHEIEIALELTPERYVRAFTVALDLTARDIQTHLKEQRHPWTLAKSFRNSCLLGEWMSLNDFANPWLELENLEFRLFINQELRQQGRVRDMIHSPQKLVNYVCDRFPVVDGDVLLTGTPAGVGPLRSKDMVVAEIVGFSSFSWVVA